MSSSPQDPPIESNPPNAPTNRPTWTTIDDDELDLPTGSTESTTMDPHDGTNARDDDDDAPEVGETSRMSDEMEDAVGGLMQMAGGSATNDHHDEDDGLPGATGLVPPAGRAEDDGEDELKDDEEEPVVPQKARRGGAPGGGRFKKKPATGKKPGRKPAGGSRLIVVDGAILPTVITTKDKENTGSTAVAAPSGMTSVDMMEVDEIADDDNVSVMDTLDVPGTRKRRGGKAGGTAGSRGKKKAGDLVGDMDDLDTPAGSAPGTPSKSARRRKTAGPPSNNGDSSLQGPGGVTKNQPQYHVMKKEDGEMCGRADIQFDFLEAIFTDPTKAFTVPPIPGHPRPLSPETKLTFGELYCYTLSGSPRATKSSKEALLGLDPGSLPGKNKAGGAGSQASKRKKDVLPTGLDVNKVEPASAVPSVAGSVSGAAADEASVGGGDDGEDVESYEGLKEGLSKVCLMINVGRINTTFAFYPLMRTMLRSYHSIPSLQKTFATRKALQDAPRLKIMLKAVLLESEETKTLPIGLTQIYEQVEAGKCPSTSICNLLLAFALRPEPAHEKFFGDYPNYVNLLTLFTPLPIKSSERSKAFLFVIYHYLEAQGSPNPFADDDQPDKLPKLNIMTQEDYDALGENVDSEEEIHFGVEMKAQRQQCVAELAQQKEEEERVKADPDAQLAAESLARESTMWPKPKKARGPAANGKKRKRPSDNRPEPSEFLLTHETLERDVDLRDTASHDGSRMDRPYSEARDAKYPPRYTPSSLDDDWAIGVETLGLDDATIQGLISQVNREAYHWASAAPAPERLEPWTYVSPDRHHHVDYKSPSRQISSERQPPPVYSESHLTPPQQPPKTHSLSSLLN